ncbi:Os04g0208800 [Oryza sativa Japonica Group]|uniref:Os04g0208800 protein n=2 Tax=Oryza sativa subsp. japonica TaxID=39947 RepID=Q0JES3_ORYSJ|nr:hypothetical protein EE612_022518 [Oryza sativa]BAF14164.1 Os04g0208800 [Oryza sativa Japonica Group]BAS88124.1 Os04g0208800 [Oryza sativa Japonica Group]|eukprot:NP_001052250.1 Os04g0208800 [Oryza sativa Japonica Group]
MFRSRKKFKHYLCPKKIKQPQRVCICLHLFILAQLLQRNHHHACMIYKQKVALQLVGSWLPATAAAAVVVAQAGVEGVVVGVPAGRRRRHAEPPRHAPVRRPPAE